MELGSTAQVPVPVLSPSFVSFELRFEDALLSPLQLPSATPYFALISLGSVGLLTGPGANGHLGEMAGHLPQPVLCM